jgi:hypothetical protein
VHTSKYMSFQVRLLDHCEALLKIQNSSHLVLATNLTAEVLRPKNWESMRVQDALAVFNTKVVELSCELCLMLCTLGLCGPQDLRGIETDSYRSPDNGKTH